MDGHFAGDLGTFVGLLNPCLSVNRGPPCPPTSLWVVVPIGSMPTASTYSVDDKTGTRRGRRYVPTFEVWTLAMAGVSKIVTVVSYTFLNPI